MMFSVFAATCYVNGLSAVTKSGIKDFGMFA